MEVLFKDLFIAASRMRTLPFTVSVDKAREAGALAREQGLSVTNCHYSYFEDGQYAVAWEEGYENKNREINNISA